jgi:hypothetical protein
LSTFKLQVLAKILYMLPDYSLSNYGVST